ncbi:STAS domain-containing protein [Streptomyces sp. NPDC002853]
MALPQLNVYRRNRRFQALITLAGEIDFGTAPLVRSTLEQCLRDGIRTIDVDLTPVTFCDCCGLNTFIEAFQHTTAAGGTLLLHYPPPTLAWMLERTGCGYLLKGLAPALVPAPLPLAPAPSPVASFEPSPRLAPLSAAASGGVL